MRRIFFSALLAMVAIALQAENHCDTILNTLKNHQDKSVLVVSHRGDWRNAPENSLQAVKNCIDMGVDIVEIDLKKTKDGKLILMHDKRIDRTTTGKGVPSDFTYDELSKLWLRNGAGHKTRHRIATLQEVMLLCKDKIMVNIDKGYEYFDDVVKVLIETGTINQCIIKSNNLYETVMAEHGNEINDKNVLYMPVVDLQKADGIDVMNSYIGRMIPVVYEINFDDDSVVCNAINKIRKAGSQVYVNSLWPELCAGHDDDRAVELDDVEGSWQWLIDAGVRVIQTDRPAALLQYLRKKGLHK